MMADRTPRTRAGALAALLALPLSACADSAASDDTSSSGGPGETDEGGTQADAEASAGATDPDSTGVDDPTGGSDPTDGTTGEASTTSADEGDTDATTTGSGCGGGPSVDRNGVAYVEIPGFTYEGGIERFDWSENFQGGGSMRHDFEGTPEGNQCVLGYFVVDGPDDEEISAKLGGGPHNDDNPEWADTHDLGIINFVGDRSRVRWEATHPDYEDAVEQDVDGIGDIRGDWVGAMGCKLNLDDDADGEIDRIWYLGWVDPEGLDADGNPNNGWVLVLDATFAVEDVGLKSPPVPYVTTIGEAEEAQATIRIDGQDDGYAYEHIAYRSPVACDR